MVCKAIELLAAKNLQGKNIEDIMYNYGAIFKQIADDPQVIS